MQMYHGSHRAELVLHEGICLTECEDVAEQYAANGEAYSLDLDIDALNVVDVEGYDHDSNDCPADHEAFRAEHAANGADVLRYEDEDENGREHTCYRLVSDKALASVSVNA